MNDDRKSSLLLIAGAAGLIITMVLHPMGRIAPAEVDAVVRKLLIVHTVALAGIALLFLGTCGIPRRFDGPDGLSRAGLGIYGYATAAALSGTVLDGLVEPRLLQQIVGSTTPTRELWQAITKYNALVDGAFIRVYAVAAAVAILLWCVSMLKNRKEALGVAVYGFILGVTTVVGVTAGFLGPEAHGFGILVVAQAIWFLLVATRMWKVEQAAVG